MKGDREQCFEAGMDGYVSKPVHFNELVEVIESLNSKIIVLDIENAAGTPFRVFRPCRGNPLAMLRE